MHETSPVKVFSLPDSAGSALPGGLHQPQLDQSRDALYLLDLDGQLVSLNERGQQPMGSDDSVPAPAGNWLSYWSGEEREKMAQAMETARRGKISRFEGACQTAPGAREWVQGTITPLLNRTGQVMHLLVISHPVTEPLQSQKSGVEQAQLSAFSLAVSVALIQNVPLREMLRQCTRALVEHLDAAFARIWTLNEADQMLELQASSGLYTHLNGKHARVPVGAFKIGKIAQERLPHLTNTVLDDPRVSDQAWARREGMVAFAGYPLLIEDRPIGVMALFARHMLSEETLKAMAVVANGIALGIERVRVQEGLHQLNTHLELQVAKRTEAFNKTNVELQRSNKELESFAYIASHDLQEPLRKIQAFGNLLQEEYGAQLDDGALYIERMRSAAARMQTLIQDLLLFSRVTTQVYPFTAVDLNVVAHEVIDDLEDAIKQTKGTIHLEQLPTLEADPLQMRQLLQNLLGNALKFHRPAVPPVVKVSAREGVQAELGMSPGGAWTHICIEDNGIGFDEHYLDRMFNVFQRLHGRNDYEGTGIGLAIVRKIVERHEGTITAHSRIGQGSVFLIMLPLHH